MLAEFECALVFFQRIDPPLGFVVRVLGGLAQPKHRIAEIIKSALLERKRGFGRG